MTLRASPCFGLRWLGPRIEAFVTESPEWTICVDATPAFTEFETKAVDFDLRCGLGGWTGLSAEGFLHDLILPLCGPGCREALRERLTDPAGMLRAARLLDGVKGPCRWELWLACNWIEVPDLTYPIRLDRSSMSLDLAKQCGGSYLRSPGSGRGEGRASCPPRTAATQARPRRPQARRDRPRDGSRRSRSGAAWSLSLDENGAEVVDVGERRSGDDLVAQAGEESMGVVPGQRRAGV